MKKQNLLNIELPAQYKDCSEWFVEGVDNIPSLLDFVQCGKSKKAYDRFMLLYNIEKAKKLLKEVESDKEAFENNQPFFEEAENLIDKLIEEYNKN